MQVGQQKFQIVNFVSETPIIIRYLINEVYVRIHIIRAC